MVRSYEGYSRAQKEVQLGQTYRSKSYLQRYLAPNQGPSFYLAERKVI